MWERRNTIFVSGTLILLLFWYLDGNYPGMLAKILSLNSSSAINSGTGALPGLPGKRSSNPDNIARLYEKCEGLLSSRWNGSDRIGGMISAIQDAAEDGLNPDDYHLRDIETLTEKIISSDNPVPEDVGNLERLLSDSFMLLASHLSRGKTDPGVADPGWKVPVRKVHVDSDRFIDSTIMAGNLYETFRQIAPQNPEYNNLKKALAIYRRYKDEGGWNSFSTTFRKLEFGMDHPDVGSLRRRLSFAQGYIKPDSVNENLFDSTLYHQVVAFQERNGLDADGVVGKSTVRALNISIDERIETIEANLERWRWINRSLAGRYIQVNIPGFKLSLMNDGREEFTTRAIVGRQVRQTPVFSARLRYMILNPDWVVPPTIMKNDVLPAIAKDQLYLSKNQMKIITNDGKEVEPSTVDWNMIPEKGFPYMIRQDPGQKNPLGRIKFIFPNENDIYIHDTPSHSLFNKSVRSFSSGCIRIDNATGLAALLLRDDPGWDLKKLQMAIDEGVSKSILLKDQLPVYILYFTAWADGDGNVFFGDDIYDRDNLLITALQQTNSRTNQ